MVETNHGDTDMTQREIKALETIIGKIETLQHKTGNGRARNSLGTAKNELLALLRNPQ